MSAPDTASVRSNAQKNAMVGALLMIGACALVAASTLLAKALGRGIGGAELHPLQITAGRFVFGLACLAPFALIRRPGFAGAAWGTHLSRALCGWAGTSCLFAAAVLMPLAEATAISFLSPLVTMVLAIPLLGERVGPWRWSAAAIAMVGAVILIQPGTDAFQIAALIALAAALFMGTEAILIKRLSGWEPALRILLINNLIGTAISLMAAAGVWTAPEPLQWALLFGVGATMVAAQVCFVWAMIRVEASFAIPFFYATLVFAALYDFAAFGELPAWTGWLGAGFIVSGALLLAWRESVQRSR